MLTCSARGVFKIFHKLERWADRATGKAGPLFVAIAVILIVVCAITFFEVVFPATFFRPDASPLLTAFGLMFCSYMLYCTTFHYIYAITTPPGSPLEGLLAAEEREGKWWVSWLRSLDITNAVSCLGVGLEKEVRSRSGRRKEKARASVVKQIIAASASSPRQAKMDTEDARWPNAAVDVARRPRNERAEDRFCKKCPRLADGSLVPKPERAHHCRVCGRCFFKYDHHCPWINQCVGLRNERYFVLFMVYLSTCCWFVVYWGWNPFMESLNFFSEWPYWTPRTCTILLWVMTLAIAFALTIMGSWHLWLISKAETSVENHDNDYYRRLGKQRGLEYKNMYDLGRRRNLELFFNVGHEGSYSYWTVLLPISVPPSSDGWAWQKRPDWEKCSLGPEEDLTDEEEED